MAFAPKIDSSKMATGAGQEPSTEEDAMLRSMKDLHGFTIGATDGDIGSVKEFYFDDVSYTVRYAVVDTGAWLSDRKVLLSPIAFRGMDWEHSKVQVTITRAQVKDSPEYDPARPIDRAYETQLHGHYGQPRYWSE
jgi:hypothetical protein